MLFLAVVGLSCDSSSPDEVGSVQGTVTDADSHGPLPGAAVTVGGASATTAVNGRFNLTDVPAGAVSITVRHDGYQPYEATVEVPEGGTITVDVELAVAGPPPSPTGLRAISSDEPSDVLELDWAPSTRASVYNLYWSDRPGVTPAIGETIPVEGTSVTHTGRTPGATYYYVLTARNRLGQGPPSHEVAATAGAGLEILGGLPPVHQPLNDAVHFDMAVAAARQIVAVEVRMAGRTAALVFQELFNAWQGTLDLTGIPRGMYDLHITAFDGTGSGVRKSVPALIDRPPTLIVTRPAEGTVARTEVEVEASCVDDDPEGCVLTQASVDGEVLTGRQEVSGTLPLRRDADQTVTFSGLDRFDQSGIGQQGVIVERSTRLVPASVGSPGQVVDADATRLLLWQGVGPGRAQLRVRDRASGAETTVTHDDARPGEGHHLVDGGVVFTWVDEARVWRPGEPASSLGIPSFVLSTAGPYVVYQAGPERVPLRRLNVLTNETVIVTSEPIYTAVAVANGDVVYGRCEQVLRFRDGGTIVIDEADGVAFSPLAADETSAVVRQQHPADRYTLSLYTASGETSLAGEQVVSFRQAAMEGGWVAFDRATVGIDQLWLRSPGGESRQVSFFGGDAVLEDLSPAGDMLFRVLLGSTAEGRYLVPSGGTPERVSGEHGRGLFLEGIPHVRLGNTLFRVQ